MTVLFDDRSINTQRLTGWERYAKCLFEALQRQEVAVAPLGLDGTTYAKRLFADFWAIPRGARKSRSPFIHFPTYAPPLSISRAQLRRTIYTVHDCTFWKYPEYTSRLGGGYYRRLAERAIAGGAKVVTVSESAAKDISERFPLSPSEVAIVHPGLSPLPKSDHVPSGRPFLLFVGTQEPRKNLDGLIRGYWASGLASELDLVICGRVAWGRDDLRAPGVRVIEAADDRILSGLYRTARALVLPSHYEGFGLPVLEAMSVGTPVICSDIPALRESTGGLATFFDQNSVDSIADGLQRGLSASRVNSSSARAWASRFSWEASAAAMAVVYAEVLATRASA